MPLAFLPSPSSAVWLLGPIPVRAFALCMVAGVLAGLWLTDRRYRRAGGRDGVILNIATVAVPVGIVGARIYSVATNSQLYFGAGRDWLDALRFWNGGLGVAGAAAAGAVAAWAYCRRAGIDLGPVALAAAPVLPVAQAIAVCGNWFTQTLYGAPSGLPWAVAIAPAHRAAGYQGSATFQPIFLYECLLYLLVAAAVSYAIRRFSLRGDTAFAVYAGLYATCRAVVEAQRVDYSPRWFGVRTDLVAMLVIMVVAWSFLLLAKARPYRRPPARVSEAAARLTGRALRPRSVSAIAERLAQLAARPEPGLPSVQEIPPAPVPADGAADPARLAEPAPEPGTSMASPGTGPAGQAATASAEQSAQSSGQLANAAQAADPA
jgi:prolipoprotein diacylglyceryl transferase